MTPLSVTWPFVSHGSLHLVSVSFFIPHLLSQDTQSQAIASAQNCQDRSYSLTLTLLHMAGLLPQIDDLQLYTWGTPLHPRTHSSDVIFNVTFPSLFRTDFLCLYLLKLLCSYSFCPSLSSVKIPKNKHCDLSIFASYVQYLGIVPGTYQMLSNMFELKTTTHFTTSP